ncbi:MAG TPA: DUF58 domain-containing protein [Planctomycetota bacterium]
METGAPARSLHVRPTASGLTLFALLPALALGTLAGLPAALAAAPFGVLVIALWLGRRNLTAVRPHLPQACTAFAWESFRLPVELAHRGGGGPVRDLLLAHGRPAGRALRLCGHLATLEADAVERVEVRFRLPRRGRHRSHELTLLSTFPFGLWEWRAGYELPADLLALPRLGAVRDVDAKAVTAGLDSGARRRSLEEEFHSLRLWREGMSRRRIHWRASAHQRRLVVSEMHGGQRPEIVLALGAAAAAEDGAHRRSFERAVSLLATLAEHFLRLRFRTTLHVAGRADLHLDGLQGRQGLYRALSALAELPLLVGDADAAARAAASLGPAILVRTGGKVRARGAGGRVLDVPLVLDVDHPSIRTRFDPDGRAGRLAGGGIGWSAA